jgi:DNA invertase Pin-like site-specific DNA recombinase
MKTVAIYARVSTSDQSAESQITALRDYAARRDFTIYREYVDHVTGVVSKRKQGKETEYQALMLDAKQKRFDVVLVWKFDRFARSLKALIEGLQLFQALKINFISVTQDIDTTTPMGVFFFQIVGAFAELEREMIVERVKSGLDNARSKGVKLGRPRAHPPAVEQLVLTRFRSGQTYGQIGKAIGMSRNSAYAIVQRHVLASSQVAALTNGGSIRPREGL